VQLRDTGANTGRQTHALGDGAGGTDSLARRATQKVVPEKLERGLADGIHNTGDGGSVEERQASSGR
jgi:hypothetical protein